MSQGNVSGSRYYDRHEIYIYIMIDTTYKSFIKNIKNVHLLLKLVFTEAQLEENSQMKGCILYDIILLQKNRNLEIFKVITK